jgi:hypothetical protein
VAKINQRISYASGAWRLIADKSWKGFVTTRRSACHIALAGNCIWFHNPDRTQSFLRPANGTCWLNRMAEISIVANDYGWDMPVVLLNDPTERLFELT